MTRRAHRDPRSLLELRRLALRAKRSSANREVLHDALLETYPRTYEKFIRKAHLLDRGRSKTDLPSKYTHEYVVIFYPRLLSRYYYKKKFSLDRLFGIDSSFVNTNTSEIEAIHYPGTLVYRTRGLL